MTEQRSEFLLRARQGGIVPVLREVVLDADTAVAAFAKVARPPFAFLLESLVGGERWARYTFLGTEPREVWRYRERRVERWTRGRGWAAAGETDDPIGHLAERLRGLPAIAVPGLPRFTGGAVGYLGYDIVRTIERLPRRPPDTLGLPDAVLMIADSLVILDNLFGRAIVVVNVEAPSGAGSGELDRLYDAAEARLDELVGRLGATHRLTPLALGDGATLAAVPTVSRYPREAFERDVARILEYIRAGDTFQTVLSRRQDAPGAADPLRLYRYLRALNPAPYLFYLALDDFTCVGSSPEVRAMEIIDELEPEGRGPYAGAVGYVSWGAVNMDTAIAIRSAVVMPDRVAVQAGAGIVADSDPGREFAETEAKAQAVLKALALAKAGD